MLASTVVQLFDSGEDRWCTSENDPDSVAAACLREVVEGLGSGVGARALGDALERAGFAKKCSQALVKRLPTTSPKFAWSSTGTESTEWTECAVKDEVLLALLKALKGCCASSERCAKTAIKDKAVESAHALELLLAPSSVCLAAEELVDACVAWPSGSKARSMREASRNARLDHASKKRDRILKRYGLEAPPQQGEKPQKRARAPSVTENVQDAEPDDAGSARCVVCREGFASRPRDALGAYIFSKLAAADVGGADGFQLVEGAAAAAQAASRPLPPHASLSCLGAMHCIHANCHRDATRAGRSLRSLGPSGRRALRNSRVLCNSIPPVRPPQATDDWASARAAYHAAVERHSGAGSIGVAAAPASQLAAAASTSSYASPSSRALRSSRFQLAAHDARLLLLRLAHNEPLHQESGGGSRRSNLELCLYLLQMAGHQLQDRDAGGAADAAHAQRERRHLDAVVAASLDRAQGSADQRKRAAEAAPHAALLALFSRRTTAGPCSASGGPAPARSSGPWTAKSRAAASAAARSRRGRAGSQGQPRRRTARSAPRQYGGAGAGARRRRGRHGRARRHVRPRDARLRRPRRQAAVRARDAARAGRDRHRAAGRPHFAV